MSRINFNKEAVSTDIINRISQATGIDAITRSSKTRLISDILVDELSNMADAYNESTDGLYVETAIGKDLDIKGAQYGLYRKIRNSIYIDKADNILSIEPQVEGQIFGDTVKEVSTIRRGETLNIGTVFQITVAEDITILPQDSIVIISGTLHSVGDVGFATYEGDVYKIDTLSTSIGLSTNTLQIRTLKPVALDGQRETDDEFRARIELARSGDRFNSVAVIRSIIGQLPDISGSSLIIGKRGSGTIDVGFTTGALQKVGSDPMLGTLKGLLSTQVSSGSALGASTSIYVPSLLELHIEYSSPASEAMDQNIRDAIVKVFLESYRYSESNSISSSTLEAGVVDILKTETISITSMSLVDPGIGASIFNGINTVISPQRYFMFLEASTISRS